MINTARSLAILAVLGTAGCSLDGLLNSDDLPRNVRDPKLTQTAEGARHAYNGALARFTVIFGGSVTHAFVVKTGVFTDELSSLEPAVDANGVDRRVAPTRLDDTYPSLQRVRGQASQAIGLLGAHVPEAPALAGHLYALEGFAEIFLAELYCSGIPLSTVDFEGDFTYRPGSLTSQVFAHAVSLFDTALTLTGDSLAFTNLARLGRARALLGRGLYADAAAAAAAVPDDYRYQVKYVNDSTFSGGGSEYWGNFAKVPVDAGNWNYTVPDREGVNGLDYRTSGDPRTRVTQVGTTGPFDLAIYHPDKYATTGDSAIVLASGVEARLIEAEAALQANPDDGLWLTKLNALRTDGTQDGGAYNPGGGRVAGLAPLSDPVIDTARVNLLFRERAFWLFLTGHRQGDLRRLIRQYGSLHPEVYNEGKVYPAGTYAIGLPYGSDVTLPIPEEERANPLFTGCASRGA